MASRREEMFRRMRRERMMMMRRGGYDREYLREMEMEMMYEHEMMYRLHGEDFEWEEMMEGRRKREEPKITEEERLERERQQDRQQMAFWITGQMLPTEVRGHSNPQDMHNDLLKYVKAARFKIILEEPDRFEIHYINHRDVPTEDDLVPELCRFAIASFNNRPYDYEKAFVLLCGVEEDLDTKLYPLATGLPYLDTNKDKVDELRTTFLKLVNRGGTRRYGIRDSEFSSIDEGMIKFDVVPCNQQAAHNDAPVAVAVLTIHPCWVFCHEWCYLFGTVDDNRRWRPKVYDFVNGRPQQILDCFKNEKMEMHLYEGYQSYRRDNGYI